jgi:4-azaleucine resistance transporter AzlC
MTTSAAAFGLVYGLAARQGGFSIVEMLSMSVFVLAGAAQFAAIGLVTQGVPWIAIVLLTALLNARHLLYSAALAPWVVMRGRVQRAAMAHVLTDETFALTLPLFRRLGRADLRGYWIASAFIVPPWIAANLLGYLGGQGIPDPTRFGLDIVFPAAMAGIAVGLITGRRELVAATVGAVVGVGVGLVAGTAVGIVAGGIVGPLGGLLVPRRLAGDAGAGAAGAADHASEGGDDPALGLTD